MMPRLALDAGLAIIKAVEGITLYRGFTPRVRIDIATGLVVVGELIGEDTVQERSVVGETPNLAARLQEHAEPGTLAIDATTRELAGRLFEYHSLGKVSLKGFAKPTRAWQVTGTSEVLSRFEARHDQTLTPIVGREEELELLRRRWRQAKAGEGRVVLISGEPGIGKSRIVAALRHSLETTNGSIVAQERRPMVNVVLPSWHQTCFSSSRSRDKMINGNRSSQDCASRINSGD
jgi:AAA ATPase domain/Adenylate and Guanylate cyclase catalytic domain